MKLLTIATALVVIAVSAAQYNDGTWRVASEGEDYITYIRRTTTTTTPAPPPRRRVPSSYVRPRRPTGDIWSVASRSDGHITYTRRSSDTGATPMGELRRFGSGRDSVMARVVPGKDDEYTEEGMLEGTATRTGYTTGDLVHPYNRRSSPASRTKSIKPQRRRPAARPPTVSLGRENLNEYPRVGDVLNGWVVISKSKDHISWERAEAAAQRRVANMRAINQDRLKSLKSTRVTNLRIPNPQGQMVEGFPRIFNTYSRAYYVNDRNVDGAGSIRTSLTDTSRWKVGDELAGWRVVSKDSRGLVWQRIRHDGNDNEVDLIDELNRHDEEESSESDSSSESESNEYVEGPPGPWYLARETKNSITWKRNNVPKDMPFDANEYPRIGDIQGEWKVRSKSRRHITWVRVNYDGTEKDSDEML